MSDDTEAAAKPAAKPRIDAPYVSLRFANGTLFAFLILLGAILWAGAEAHDNNCYSKASIRALEAVSDSGSSPQQTNCLILPWNEP